MSWQAAGYRVQEGTEDSLSSNSPKQLHEKAGALKTHLVSGDVEQV